MPFSRSASSLSGTSLDERRLGKKLVSTPGQADGLAMLLFPRTRSTSRVDFSKSKRLPSPDRQPRQPGQQHTLARVRRQVWPRRPRATCYSPQARTLPIAEDSVRPMLPALTEARVAASTKAATREGRDAGSPL